MQVTAKYDSPLADQQSTDVHTDQQGRRPLVDPSSKIDESHRRFSAGEGDSYRLVR
jgi:hypothetical protein